MNYAQRLKDLREDKDLTQADIAKILKTSQAYYGQYENGKRELPFFRAIELAKFYNVSLDYIAGITNELKVFSQSETKNYLKNLATKDIALIEKYHQNKELQKAIDKLLDL